MTARPKLAAVPKAQLEEPPPDLSYEYRQRQFIASRDWAAVHIAGDKRPPFFWERVRGAWR